MTSRSNNKIEAVYPLNELQRALLFNHRADPVHDEGLIQMHFRLRGPLDRERFFGAWQRTFRRHPVLRASVHWENMSQPVWVVHPQADPVIHWLAGAGAQENGPRERWETFLDEDRRTPLELTKAPACRFAVLPIGAEDHYFAWTSHHLLLDGWSAETILKDVLLHYGAEDPRLPPVPNHKEYLRWLTNQDRPAALAYWRDELARHRGQSRFAPGGGAQREARTAIPAALRREVEAFARSRSLSLNTVMQGVWAALLGKYFGTPTVCFGTTVSGRPAEIPGFESVAGMYVNVLPKVVDLETGEGYFAEIQSRNGLSQPHQYLAAEEVLATGNASVAPFNCLLTVQNYPWSELAAGDLRVTEYHGDMTSNFPVTCLVVLREEWEIVLRHQPDSVPEAQAEWLLAGFRALLERLEQLPGGGALPAVPDRSEPGGEPAYVPPRSPTQVELVRIWSDLLPAERIGIDDDFFRLGGTSFLAIRLFGRIEERFGRRLPPASLLTHRTVRALEGLLNEAADAAEWNNLVPLRVAGHLPPVFCFHAGEGHILMYDELVGHLHPDRPVYALQPNGLDGASELDGSIEEMAAHYLAEIDRLGVEGPLVLLAYCYSGAICLEIGRRLLAAGRPAPVIIGTDIDPPGKPAELTGGRRGRRRGSPAWYWGHIRLGMWERVRVQLAEDFLPENLLGADMRQRLRARRLKGGLIEAFEQYGWPEYAGEIYLIRSAELISWPRHDYVVESWRRLTGGRLRLGAIDCKHADIYREPAVAELAGMIEEYVRERT